MSAVISSSHIPNVTCAQFLLLSIIKLSPHRVWMLKGQLDTFTSSSAVTSLHGPSETTAEADSRRHGLTFRACITYMSDDT